MNAQELITGGYATFDKSSGVLSFTGKDNGVLNDSVNLKEFNAKYPIKCVDFKRLKDIKGFLKISEVNIKEIRNFNSLTRIEGFINLSSILTQELDFTNLKKKTYDLLTLNINIRIIYFTGNVDIKGIFINGEFYDPA